MDELVRVKILNREYPLRVEPKDTESTRQLAANLNKRMMQFKKDHAGQPDLVAAVMVAMEMGEELARYRAREAKTDNLLKNELDKLSHEPRSCTAITEPEYKDLGSSPSRRP